MNVAAWLTPNVEYSQKLWRSALEGARSGEADFLHGKPFHLFVDESAWHALPPAALAACLGALGACSGRRRISAKALAYAVLGGTLGFSAALAWQSRGLTASVAAAAWKKINRARDEHWLENHPIDYA